jgi:aryl-alcohol dehydrogenase-like predicted oxidoreductase
MKECEWNRRTFLKKAPVAMAGLAAATGAGVALGGTAWAQADKEPKCSPEKAAQCMVKSCPHAQAAAGAEARESGIKHYRRLGRTGLEVSDISMGAAVDEAVLKYAFDSGINFFDTADSYYSGGGETALGSAFKGTRDKVIIATKHMLEPTWTKSVIEDKVNASLKRLNTDYVDLLFMQGVGDPALFKNEEILSAYEGLKKQGKYRHLCFSTHDTELVVPPAIESGLFDAALLMYDTSLFPKMHEMHQRLFDADIGLIAMKTLRGGEHNDVQKKFPGLTFAQASIRWALKDKKVSTVLISMRTFEHVDEYLAVSGSGLT